MERQAIDSKSIAKPQVQATSAAVAGEASDIFGARGDPRYRQLQQQHPTGRVNSRDQPWEPAQLTKQGGGINRISIIGSHLKGVQQKPWKKEHFKKIEKKPEVLPLSEDSLNEDLTDLEPTAQIENSFEPSGMEDEIEPLSLRCSDRKQILGDGNLIEIKEINLSSKIISGAADEADGHQIIEVKPELDRGVESTSAFNLTQAGFGGGDTALNFVGGTASPKQQPDLIGDIQIKVLPTKEPEAQAPTSTSVATGHHLKHVNQFASHNIISHQLIGQYASQLQQMGVISLDQSKQPRLPSRQGHHPPGQGQNLGSSGQLQASHSRQGPSRPLAHPSGQQQYVSEINPSKIMAIQGGADDGRLIYRGIVGKKQPKMGEGRTGSDQKKPFKAFTKVQNYFVQRSQSSHGALTSLRQMHELNKARSSFDQLPLPSSSIELGRKSQKRPMDASTKQPKKKDDLSQTLPRSIGSKPEPEPMVRKGSEVILAQTQVIASGGMKKQPSAPAFEDPQAFEGLSFQHIEKTNNKARRQLKQQPTQGSSHLRNMPPMKVDQVATSSMALPPKNSLFKEPQNHQLQQHEKVEQQVPESLGPNLHVKDIVKIPAKAPLPNARSSTASRNHRKNQQQQLISVYSSESNPNPSRPSVAARQGLKSSERTHRREAYSSTRTSDKPTQRIMKPRYDHQQSLNGPNYRSSLKQSAEDFKRSQSGSQSLANLASTDPMAPKIPSKFVVQRQMNQTAMMQPRPKQVVPFQSGLQRQNSDSALVTTWEKKEIVNTAAAGGGAQEESGLATTAPAAVVQPRSSSDLKKAIKSVSRNAIGGSSLKSYLTAQPQPQSFAGVRGSLPLKQSTEGSRVKIKLLPNQVIVHGAQQKKNDTFLKYITEQQLKHENTTKRLAKAAEPPKKTRQPTPEESQQYLIDNLLGTTSVPKGFIKNEGAFSSNKIPTKAKPEGGPTKQREGHWFEVGKFKREPVATTKYKQIVKNVVSKSHSQDKNSRLQERIPPPQLPYPQEVAGTALKNPLEDQLPKAVEEPQSAAKPQPASGGSLKTASLPMEVRKLSTVKAEPLKKDQETSPKQSEGILLETSHKAKVLNEKAKIRKTSSKRELNRGAAVIDSSKMNTTSMKALPSKTIATASEKQLIDSSMKGEKEQLGQLGGGVKLMEVKAFDKPDNPQPRPAAAAPEERKMPMKTKPGQLKKGGALQNSLSSKLLASSAAAQSSLQIQGEQKKALMIAAEVTSSVKDEADFGEDEEPCNIILIQSGKKQEPAKTPEQINIQIQNTSLSELKLEEDSKEEKKEEDLSMFNQLEKSEGMMKSTPPQQEAKEPTVDHNQVLFPQQEPEQPKEVPPKQASSQIPNPEESLQQQLKEEKLCEAPREVATTGVGSKMEAEPKAAAIQYTKAAEEKKEPEEASPSEESKEKKNPDQYMTLTQRKQLECFNKNVKACLLQAISLRTQKQDAGGQQAPSSSYLPGLRPAKVCNCRSQTSPSKACRAGAAAKKQYWQYAVNTHTGIQAKKVGDSLLRNQDRVAIVQSVGIPQVIYNQNKKKRRGAEDFQVVNESQFSYFGLYEGIGDSMEAAEHLRDMMHKYIISNPHFPANPTQALNDSIVQCMRFVNTQLNKKYTPLKPGQLLGEESKKQRFNKNEIEISEDYEASEEPVLPGAPPKSAVTPKNETIPMSPTKQKNGQQRSSTQTTSPSNPLKQGKDEGERIASSQMLSVMLIDDICLCANAGASRALMSSDVGDKLYCLNTDHQVPGNEYEEHRIVSQLTSYFIEAKKSSDVGSNASKINEIIASLKMPVTRAIGPPPRFEKVKDPLERKLQRALITQKSDITAIQLSNLAKPVADEDFLLLGSPAMFNVISSQDVQAVIWQAALEIASSVGEEHGYQLSADLLLDTLLFYVASQKSEGNLTGILVLNKGFGEKVAELTARSAGPNTPNFGELRMVGRPQFEVDEIELEPIPVDKPSFFSDDDYIGMKGSQPQSSTKLSECSDEDNIILDENCDEIIFNLHHGQQHLVTRPFSNSKKSSYRIYDRANLLSSIAEESSLQEQDNVSSIVTN